MYNYYTIVILFSNANVSQQAKDYNGVVREFIPLLGEWQTEP